MTRARLFTPRRDRPRCLRSRGPRSARQVRAAPTEREDVSPSLSGSDVAGPRPSRFALWLGSFQIISCGGRTKVWNRARPALSKLKMRGKFVESLISSLAFAGAGALVLVSEHARRTTFRRCVTARPRNRKQARPTNSARYRTSMGTVRTWPRLRNTLCRSGRVAAHSNCEGGSVHRYKPERRARPSVDRARSIRSLE